MLKGIGNLVFFLVVVAFMIPFAPGWLILAAVAALMLAYYKVGPGAKPRVATGVQPSLHTSLPLNLNPPIHLHR